jgi:hypothetical protein
VKAGDARSGSWRRVKRFRLYEPTLARNTTYPLSDLGHLTLSGFPSRPRWTPRARVIAYLTSDGRYGAFQATQLNPGAITIRYRTYEKDTSSLAIVGGVRCLGDLSWPRGKGIFTPAEPIRDRDAREDGPAIYKRGRIGDWTVEQASTLSVGRFDAVCSGLARPVTYAWEASGRVLSSGNTAIEGESFSVEVAGPAVIFRPASAVEVSFPLKVTANGADGQVLTAARCVSFKPCKRKRRVPAGFQDFRKKFAENFGIVPIAKGARVGKES